MRPTPVLARNEALATLARRYFTSHGPATARDFAWWSGLTMADARRGAAMVGSGLESLEIGGERYWFAPAANAGRVNACVHLLPNYDEHVVAYRDHGHTLDADAHQTIRDRGAAPLGAHLIARDGRVVGRWQRSIERTGARVVTQLLKPLRPRDRRALAAAAEEYGRFLELPVSLSAA